MKVIFSARIADRSSHRPSKIRLLRLEAGGYQREVAVMQDKGAHGDLAKNDGTYTCRLKLKEPIAGLLSFTVEAVYPDSLQPLRSRPFFVDVMSQMESAR